FRRASLAEPVDTAEYQRNPPPRPAEKILRNLCMLFFHSSLGSMDKTPGVFTTSGVFFMAEWYIISDAVS
ncbi:MAG: hypothetical protein LBL49_07425, partial [Clostridiales Family XIII bacterium]|nr:hypothetical protein [Clostridiales Family XIII bacterium]